MVPEEIIKQISPQFNTEKLLNEIREFGKVYDFEEGDIIIDKGVEIPYIPLILEGTLRIIRRDEEDHELLLYFLEPGQTCATSLTCCMEKSKSEVEAIAENEVKLIGLPSHKIREWLFTYPEWTSFLFNTFQMRFDEMLDTINSIAFTQLDQRLLKYLHQRSEVRGSKKIKTSHQEIATDLNSSREVISRLLKQMEKKGLLTISRNTIELM